MQTNIHSLTPDVLIVGTGPCGITLAVELARSGVSVLLVDSGGHTYDPTQQSLAELASADPKRHASMSLATRRQRGGASVIWGGRCVPFDPVDLETRSFICGAEWPITWEDVEGYHAKACEYFFCGRDVFDAEALTHVDQKQIIPGFQSGDFSSSALERWSLPTNFGKEYQHEIEQSPRIQLISKFTVTEIELSEDHKSVTGVLGVAADGKKMRLVAGCIVIAAGGLETTRLLMASDRFFPGGLGNHSGHLGRYYMGHISGRIADVCFSTPRQLTKYGFERDVDGTYLRHRFALSREAQLREQVPNFAAWLVNPTLANPCHGNGILSFAALALASPFGRFFASEAIRRALIEGYTKERAAAHWRNMLKNAPETLAFILSFGYRRFVPRRRVPGFFVASRDNRYPLHYHAEQVPNAESYVSLSEERDAIGMRRLNVDFKFSQQDVDGVLKCHAILDRQLKACGVGHLTYHRDDREAHVWEQATDGFHQAGTTRMSARPEDGVVDPHLQVHGIRGLYVASSSVFPTSGQANSTFHAVALTLRLAEHLKKEFRP